MAGSEQTGGQWLKYSCLGCLAIVALIILIAGVMLGLAWNKAESAKIEDRVLKRELPEPPEDALTPESIAGDMPGAGHMLAGGSPGRVVLDLADADFSIDPAPPGEPARVEATYDLNSFSLLENLERADDGTWTYTVRFKREGSWSIIGILSQIVGGHSPRVHVFLPPGSPMDLDLKVRQGGARVDLGGLWLRSADLEVTRGGFQVRFGEPLREPLEHLAIDVSMGGGSFDSIGNASPRVLEVSHRMGGMELDLRGHWIGDSRIRLGSSMGGCVVRLPRGVRIDGLSAAGKNRSDPEGAPLLTFEVDQDLGDLEFVD